MSTSPIIFEATADGLVPLKRFENVYAAEFEEGQRYRMAEVEDRDMRSHRHFFAALREAWLSLPIAATKRWPTEKHFRKWLLVQEGFCDYAEIACKDHQAARVAARAFRRSDSYAVIKIEEDVVRVWCAESQDTKRMGKERFQKSKWACLDRAGAMIGMDAQQLMDHVKEAQAA